ncbi:cytochrome P450 [Trametes meyenii]|nr:cytochrome P450 [Trametes meyenii]
MALSITSPDVLAVLFAGFAYGLWRIYRFLVFVNRTPLRVLPGPPAQSWIHGNLKQLVSEENHVLPDKWFRQYGKHFIDREFFMIPRLWTLDPRIIQHVLTHSVDYPRPEENRKNFKEILGRGLIFVQGEEHRLQRRILNPAFGPAQVRDLTEIFVQKAIELRNIWITATQAGPTQVNVSKDLSRMTLDVIGLAGFGYDFNALDPSGKPNELSMAFQKLFSNAAPISSVWPFLRTLIPLLKLFPSKRLTAALESSATLRRVGTQIVAERKAAILREMSEKHQDGVERKDLKSRDLLTLLIKANMAKDVPEDQRLSDADVLGQIPTFLIAGHETTSTATTWALYALSQRPAMQQKLRDELLSVPTDTPTMNELMALPYLDHVVHETLRLHSPITMLVREAQHDDVLPLSEPFTDRFGKMHNEIRIAKGNRVVLPVMALHRSKEIWGEDALEFKPERWEQPPEAISAIPGVWGHLLTFIGGPRACIGYRFSLVEIKALLFTLIRAFQFELGVPFEDILIKTAPLQRPSVRSAPEKGFQLPLLLKPYKAA